MSSFYSLYVPARQIYTLHFHLLPTVSRIVEIKGLCLSVELFPTILLNLLHRVNRHIVQQYAYRTCFEIEKKVLGMPMSLVHQHEMWGDSKFCSYKVHKASNLAAKMPPNKIGEWDTPCWVPTSWRRLQVSKSWNQSTEWESTHCINLQLLAMFRGPLLSEELKDVLAVYKPKLHGWYVGMWLAAPQKSLNSWFPVGSSVRFPLELHDFTLCSSWPKSSSAPEHVVYNSRFQTLPRRR